MITVSSGSAHVFPSPPVDPSGLGRYPVPPSSTIISITPVSVPFSSGSEVITPALTFSTSVGCLVKNDLIPVFVDVESIVLLNIYYYQLTFF